MRSVLARVVAIAALALALCLVLVWIANFALTRAVTDALGADTVVTAMAVLGWAELGLAVVVLGGLAVGAWLHRPLWARGVASVTVGMALHWGWWLLDRRFDLFGTTNPDLAPADALARAGSRMWTTLGIDVVAVLVLVLGGVLLLRHRGSPDADDAADDRSEDLTPVGEASVRH